MYKWINMKMTKVLYVLMKTSEKLVVFNIIWRNL